MLITASEQMISILVVDDSEVDRIQVRRLLQKHLEDVEVTTANDGAIALESLADHQPNLVITDMRMPGLSGLDVLREAKKRKPHVGVIMLTAFGEVQSYLEAMDHGVFEYINKPVRVDELKIVIRNVLGSSST